ncbi:MULTISPECIES: MerR family transcriptional regulator [unclassified Bacillus (in: firmicutes)]|uniref:MerR family transcriptional regulator n=1 Tax=unclassified Bacillus (in: firmicutes) TaxID=185979 RepID=UPI001BE8DEF6|nr:MULTISPECIES: MerR family transcriptional regulator [unclassified Bacillus (in: firmicutes)]MBT2725205.1 MerR family transcriptional regulator [Bacillus sp. ISL-46]MBT2744439.1 MerR family transcriptional regulator [Bacillus sp. ISL-77]
MYRIGEIAKLKNISKRTIDYYTQIGLLNPIRTDSNYRLYSEECLQILTMVEHYKNLNMPLEEIKSSIELIKSDNTIDKQKVEKHVEQIASIMQHLKEEINVMEPILQKLNNQQKESLVNKLSSEGITLAQTLLLLFS